MFRRVVKEHASKGEKTLGIWSIAWQGKWEHQKEPSWESLQYVLPFV